MSASELKARLFGRYSATQRMGWRTVPGGWTCIEEFMGIDVLAFSAHASPKPSIGVRYPRVGHEVKVSRSDYRREVLAPHKRSVQVEWCNAFYFAVPTGLLTKDEIAWDEPEWEAGDFVRTPCPDRCYSGKRRDAFIGPLSENRCFRWHIDVPCETCQGRGYTERSRVEREAPTLWVPRDVGLIEVDGRGCRVTKRAPVRHEVPDMAAGGRLNDLVRWVSVRPDPRHSGLVREVAAA